MDYQGIEELIRSFVTFLCIVAVILLVAVFCAGYLLGGAWQ